MEKSKKWRIGGLCWDADGSLWYGRASMTDTNRFDLHC
jgi:hypothetical protein